MGSMSASDAAPLPRLGEIFFDVRGSSRSMRLSWYDNTGVAVFSIWQGGTCTGTFRLPMDDLTRLVDSLRRGVLDGQAGENSGPDRDRRPAPPAGDRRRVRRAVHRHDDGPDRRAGSRLRAVKRQADRGVRGGRPELVAGRERCRGDRPRRLHRRSGRRRGRAVRHHAAVRHAQLYGTEQLYDTGRQYDAAAVRRDSTYAATDTYGAGQQYGSPDQGQTSTAQTSTARRVSMTVRRSTGPDSSTGSTGRHSSTAPMPARTASPVRPRTGSRAISAPTTSTPPRREARRTTVHPGTQTPVMAIRGMATLRRPASPSRPQRSRAVTGERPSIRPSRASPCPPMARAAAVLRLSVTGGSAGLR